MHMVTTALVVLLSIVSLTMIIVAGARSKNCRSYVSAPLSHWS